MVVRTDNAGSPSLSYEHFCLFNIKEAADKQGVMQGTQRW